MHPGFQLDGPGDLRWALRHENVPFDAATQSFAFDGKTSYVQYAAQAQGYDDFSISLEFLTNLSCGWSSDWWPNGCGLVGGKLSYWNTADFGVSIGAATARVSSRGPRAGALGALRSSFRCFRLHASSLPLQSNCGPSVQSNCGPSVSAITSTSPAQESYWFYTLASTTRVVQECWSEGRSHLCPTEWNVGHPRQQHPLHPALLA